MFGKWNVQNNFHVNLRAVDVVLSRTGVLTIFKSFTACDFRVGPIPCLLFGKIRFSKKANKYVYTFKFIHAIYIYKALCGWVSE